MLQDWVPARTSLAAGVVVKQHVLERNKYPLPQLTQSQYYYTGSISHLTVVQDGMTTPISSTDFESYPLEETSGGSGGSLESSELLVYSTSSFSLVNSVTETFTVNLGSNGVYRVTADIVLTGGDPITDNNLNIYNSNETGSTELIYNKTATSSPLGYTLNEIFNLTSGYITFAQSSSQIPDPIVITNLNIYLQPDYYRIIETPYGTGSILITNEYDYNGELEGTIIEVTDGNLNGNNIFLKSSTVPTNYTPTFYKTNIVNEGIFLSFNTIPNPGEIYLLYDTGSTISSIAD